MTGNYKYYQQVDFTGGIQSETENAKANQVRDANNLWVPESRVVRRPGVSGTVAVDLPFASSPVATWVNLVVDTSGSFTYLTPTQSISAVAGQIVYFVFQGGGALDLQNIYTITASYTSGVSSSATCSFEIFTARGWVTVPQASAKLNNPALQYYAFPKDSQYTTINFGGSIGNQTCLLRSRVISVPGGGSIFCPSGINALELASIKSSLLNDCRIFGGFKIEYASSTQNISVVNNRIGLGTFTTTIARGPALLHLNYSSGFGFSSSTLDALPPIVAAIPEFNTAYMALNNQIFEIPAFTTPSVAAVSTDPNVIGPLSTNPLATYSTDVYALMNTFPAANFIVYFKQRLWAAGIQGLPNFIQWSGVAGDLGYNVWPTDSQTYLSTAQDNSEITALATLGDNLVVFKKNSIWQMVDAGDADNNLALFEARLVVAGVGCIAHGSVQAVNGGLIFLSEDGFYFYDGTPNIKRISDNVKEYVTRINAARTPFAQAKYWRTKNYYFCAVSLDAESSSNNYVFVYDVQQGSWWIFSGWDVQCWYQQDGVGLKEELYFLDRYGRAYQLERGDTDNGTVITTMLLTQRFGEDESMTKSFREVRLRGQNDNGPVTFDVLTSDVETITGKVMTMPLTGEAKWADNPANGVADVPPRRRERKHPIRALGEWVQVQINNSLKIMGIDIGYTPDGRR